VRLAFAVIRQLRTTLAEGTTAGGLLLGALDADALRIDRLEMLADGASGMDAFRGLRQRHENGPDSETVLGFFRTQTSGWLEARDEDHEVAEKCFPGLLTLCLTVQTPAHRPWSAVLRNLGPDGESRTKGHEFFFDEYLLRKGPPATSG
jgi:hypothetical protein